MSDTPQDVLQAQGGIEVHGFEPTDVEPMRDAIESWLAALGLRHYVRVAQGTDRGGGFVRFGLDEPYASHWTPDFDTLQLCDQLRLDTEKSSDDLEREILVAMLAGPLAYAFPNHQELQSAVRIRKNIVECGRRTALAFDTEEAQRPEEYWTYSEERGFTIRPGQSLIKGLEKATQPDQSGRLYSFSCYRATEYVMLLAIARELAICNPPLLSALQQQWETRALMSSPFHDVFLHEHGSLASPLPARYYVPGDRLWFRNPDERSSNVEGYEGSWVFYLGNGLFTNFWKRDQPFTLTTKCIEIFHWRNATYRDAAGMLRVDDDRVDELVRRTLQDPAECGQILQRMLRLREAAGLYLDGGCVDATREYARYVRPGTVDMLFPG